MDNINLLEMVETFEAEILKRIDPSGIYRGLDLKHLVDDNTHLIRGGFGRAYTTEIINTLILEKLYRGKDFNEILHEVKLYFFS